MISQPEQQITVIHRKIISRKIMYTQNVVEKLFPDPFLNCQN